MGTFAAEGKSTPRRGAECPFSLMPRRCRGISLPPSRRSRDTSLAEGGKAAPEGAAGRCTPRVLVPLRSTAWASPPTEGCKGRVRKTAGGAEPRPYGRARRVRSHIVGRGAVGQQRVYYEARLGDGGGAKREGTKCAVLHGGFCFVRTFRGKTGSHNNCGKRCGNCAKPLAERVRGGCKTLFFVGRW